MEELLNWPIFRLLDKNSLHQVRLAHVYNNGTEAYYVNDHDDVFQLKMSIEDQVITKTKIQQICQKKLISIDVMEGDNYYVCLAENGKLYTNTPKKPWTMNTTDHDADIAASLQSEHKQESSDSSDAEERSETNDISNLSKDQTLTNQELSKVKIVQVACGQRHTLALSSEGEVFAWGENDEGQYEFNDDCRSKTIAVGDVTESLKPAAGFNFRFSPTTSTTPTSGTFGAPAATSGSLFGSVSGSGFSMGSANVSASASSKTNGRMIAYASRKLQSEAPYGSPALPLGGGSLFGGQTSKPTTHAEKTLYKLKFKSRVVTVRASGNFTAVLTENGLVYVSGTFPPTQYDNGQTLTGTGSNDFITDIALGQNHILALTDKGVILACGGNQNGQLGNGSTTSNSTLSPTKSTKEGARKLHFSSIATHSRSNMSAGVSTTGRVYVWGEWKGQNRLTPLRTGLQSLDSVFADSGKTFRNVKITKTMTKDIVKSFDNSSDSDCRFHVGGKTIHASKFILRARSDYFSRMLDGDWKESDGEINITKYSYEAYYQYIRYLYTDVVDVSFDFSLELLELAHEVLDEILVEKCIEHIRQQLLTTNVCYVYATAKKLMELKRLLNYSRQFTMTCITDVLRSEAFAGMPDTMAKDFVCYVVGNEFKRSEDETETEDARQTETDLTTDTGESGRDGPKSE